MKKLLFIGLFSCLMFSIGCADKPKTSTVVTCYVDSKVGSDANSGRSPALAWKSFVVLETTKLNPGDTVRFNRGSEFEGLLTIKRSGTLNNYITFSDYGDKSEQLLRYKCKVS
jgi:hypothetical protein